ncbi:anti-sigma factor [Brucella pseudogrignonensis]|uniref:anti-sigma factor n=1 Tax=Brucella pseudogrignonensis TaxID=419475 RepID=UPI0028B3DE14|nr:anti-sigma factor [Brucella pseudogrignonensis]MDT6942073.1 anti-sigma factor [Brucella pseudogrignonensis]
MYDMIKSFDNIPELADEYVLGLLNPDEALQVETEISRSDELKHAVANSRERFLALDTSVTPMCVDERVWETVQNQLSDNPAPAIIPVKNANDNKPGVNGWRLAALSASAASIFFALGLGWSLTRTIEPVVIAVLLDDTGGVQAIVEDFGNESARVRLLNNVEIPSGKTIQVWTLPSKEMGPVSMGLLEGAHSAQLKGPDLPLPRGEQLYELTLEPAGGSPTGRPTGPILSKGYAKTPL